MATNGGPNIIEDGLILSIDAANKKSYPGSGTTWKDLSGNGNNGTLVNNPTFDSGNGGSIVLDGVDAHISFNTAILSGRSELSIGMWVYSNTGNSGGNYWAEGGTPNSTAWWQFSLVSSTWWTRDSSTGDQGSRNNDLNINLVSSNTWAYITAVYSVSLSLKGFYVNGSLVASTSTSIDTLTSTRVPFQSFIGRPTDPNDSNDNYWNGHVSNVQIYDHPLSSSEITQNYNALKSRFGL